MGRAQRFDLPANSLCRPTTRSFQSCSVSGGDDFHCTAALVNKKKPAVHAGLKAVNKLSITTSSSHCCGRGFLRIGHHPVSRGRESGGSNWLRQGAIGAHAQRSQLGQCDTSTHHAAVNEQVRSALIKLAPMTGGDVDEGRAGDRRERSAGGVQLKTFDRIVSSVRVVDAERVNKFSATGSRLDRNVEGRVDRRKCRAGSL